MKQVITMACAVCLATGAAATEIVYTPVNPSFGGNPLNGSFLLGSAQLQDNYKDPDSKDLDTTKSDVDQFNDLLQRSALNRLAAALSGGLVDASGQLKAAHQEFADFTLDILPLGGGLVEITTTDKLTGASTTVKVQQ
jgi:curli production assembly/transport component CsgF